MSCNPEFFSEICILWNLLICFFLNFFSLFLTFSLLFSHSVAFSYQLSFQFDILSSLMTVRYHYNLSCQRKRTILWIVSLIFFIVFNDIDFSFISFCSVIYCYQSHIFFMNERNIGSDTVLQRHNGQDWL